MAEGAALKRRTGCPSCGGSSLAVIARESYGSESLRTYLSNQYQGRAHLDRLSNMDYELVRCSGCTLAFQITVPTDDLAQDIYDKWISPSEKERLRESRPLADYADMAEQVQFLIRYFGGKPYDVDVLDFGMGWAEWVSMARSFGCRITGSELSSERLSHAHSMGIETVALEELAGRQYAFINTEQVFEHLMEPLPVLKELVKALKPNGLLRISVPDCRKALKRFSSHGEFGKLSAADAMFVAPLEHINAFEHESLVALCSQAGLRLVRPKLRDIYNSSSGWLSVKNALRLAARPVYRYVYPKSTLAYFALN